MARPIGVSDLVVILRALILVLDEEADGRARRHLAVGAIIREHARNDPDAVGLAPLRGEARLARATPIEIALDVGFGKRDAGRAAVDDAADRHAMALAEGGDAEEMTEAVMRHRRRLGYASDRRPAPDPIIGRSAIGRLRR